MHDPKDPLDSYTFKKYITDHKKWVETEAKEGERFVVGLTRVPGVNLWLHNLKYTIKELAKSLSIDLTDDEIERIDFKNVKLPDQSLFAANNLPHESIALS